jgi:Cu-processing system permease protein
MRKEAGESLKNRWFILYTVCFSVLALLVLLFSTMGGEIAGFSGFGRTAASIINLVLIFIPLIAVITGGISISQERENGTLSYLLSHPISKNEVFLGKFFGLLITIWFSILLGFGIAGVGVAITGGQGQVSGYLLTVLLSVLLAACFLSIGFLISVYSGRASKAIGISVFIWLIFIILGDLGIMGTTVIMDLGIKQVFALALINPAEVFKIASVLVLSPRFEILGPVGVYAVRTFGQQGVFYLLFSIMVLWVLLPFACAYLVFTRFRKEEI